MSPLYVSTTRAQRLHCFVCLNNIAQYQEKSEGIRDSWSTRALRDRLIIGMNLSLLVLNIMRFPYLFFLSGLFNDQLWKWWFLCIQRGETNLFVCVQKVMDRGQV